MNQIAFMIGIGMAQIAQFNDISHNYTPNFCLPSYLLVRSKQGDRCGRPC